MSPVFTACCSFMCRKNEDNLNTPESRSVSLKTNSTDAHQITVEDIAEWSTDFQMVIFARIARYVFTIIVLAPPIVYALLDVILMRLLSRGFRRTGQSCLRRWKIGHRSDCYWGDRGWVVQELTCIVDGCCVRIDRQSRWLKYRTTFSFSLLIVLHFQRLNQISNGQLHP